MDSKEKNQAAEAGKALELDELDQVTGGAALIGREAIPTPGIPTKASGILNQVVSNVVGHDAVSTKGFGSSAEIENVTDAIR